MNRNIPISATLSELLEQGHISISLDESIQDRQDREVAHRTDLKVWGHTVRVCPGDVQFTLEGSDKSLDLYPNKYLRELRVENHVPVKATTEPPHVYNVRMGGAFYKVHMNPEEGPPGNDAFILTIIRV